MSNLVFRAELSTPVGGVVGIIETTTIEELRKAIVREWIPMLQDGDIIQVFETYRD